jgi:fructose/tagatose bisphosphate aldolase
MGLMPFSELMNKAAAGGYAVGYFEPWGLDSLWAILQGAEAAQAPVIVGFSGINLPNLLGGNLARFRAWAQAGRCLCETAMVPVAYLFNETPHWEWALGHV